MRVLHAVKTSEGAFFAGYQAAELVRHGVDLHVVVPRSEGRCIPDWIAAGAKIHVLPMDFPAKTPWRIPAICDRVRRLVAEISPDLIHSHHVGPTLILRMALGRSSKIPRIFQVPGPLHLEHGFFRRLDLHTAGPQDYWIGTSRYTVGLYRRAGIAPERLFLSYYGWPVWRFAVRRTNVLRKSLGIADDQLVVGNMNMIYAPKYYLGQFVGLKCHEDIIDALEIVTRRRADVVGVLVGGAWGGARAYEERLRKRARKAGGERIRMPGFLPAEVVCQAWPDFDCAVHVPMSENCGGVLEPLLAGVPVIGGNVGGIPELVLNGRTGTLVENRRPAELAEKILDVLGNPEQTQSLTTEGRRHALELFDVRRTAKEVLSIYERLLAGTSALPGPNACQSSFANAN